MWSSPRRLPPSLTGGRPPAQCLPRRLLKKFRGDFPTAPPVLPQIEHGRALPIPAKVLKASLHRDVWHVLVQWVGLDVAGVEKCDEICRANGDAELHCFIGTNAPQSGKRLKRSWANRRSWRPSDHHRRNPRPQYKRGADSDVRKRTARCS